MVSAASMVGAWVQSAYNPDMLARVRTSRPRLVCKAAETAVKTNDLPIKDSSPIDIIVRDCRFLQQHTGVDLLTTLAPVRDVHDQVGCFLQAKSCCGAVLFTAATVAFLQVVAVLNPLAKEKLTEDLQEEISQLQSGLQQAHEEVC